MKHHENDHLVKVCEVLEISAPQGAILFLEVEP